MEQATGCVKRRKEEMAYVLQLDPNVPQAWQFMVSWPGYWAGAGYVEDPIDAIQFRRVVDANKAMRGNFHGINGCLKIVKLA